MSGDSLQIKTLLSFQVLTESDQKQCADNYNNEPLQEKHRLNKYLKRTEHIDTLALPDQQDNECFLTYDVCPLNYKYSAIIFCICGITHHFHYVIYMSVVEDTKLVNPDQFICDLLANIIIVEIPKMSHFFLKFVLCPDNPINTRVLQLFAESKATAKYYNTFPFITEASGLRHTQLHDPYAQMAWIEIMQGNIDVTTVRNIFQKHRERALERRNAELKKFVDDFYTVARDLLSNRFSINLRLCTMERLESFEQIVKAHMHSYKDRTVSRLFLFELLRALLHIYSL